MICDVLKTGKEMEIHGIETKANKDHEDADKIESAKFAEMCARYVKFVIVNIPELCLTSTSHAVYSAGESLGLITHAGYDDMMRAMQKFEQQQNGVSI